MGVPWYLDCFLLSGDFDLPLGAQGNWNTGQVLKEQAVSLALQPLQDHLQLGKYKQSL